MVTSGYRQPFWKITMQTICFKASIVQLCNQPWTINHVKSKRAQLTLFKQYSLLWINTNMQLYSIWMNCVGVENNGKKKQTKHLCANTVQYWTQTVCTFKVYSFLTCMQCHALYFKLDVLLWWVLCAVIDTRQPPEGTAWTDFIIYRNRRVQRHQMKYWTDTVWRIVFNLKTVLLYIWFKCVNSGEEREGEERGGEVCPPFFNHQLVQALPAAFWNRGARPQFTRLSQPYQGGSEPSHSSGRRLSSRHPETCPQVAKDPTGERGRYSHPPHSTGPTLYGFGAGRQ